MLAPVSSFIAAAICAIATGCIVLTGLFSALVPSGWLPTHSQHALIAFHSGAGVWMAMFAALALAFSSRWPQASTALPRVAMLACQRDPIVLLGSAGFAAVGLSAWSRYQPWVRTSAGGARGEVPGWGIPFAGPTGLIGVLTLAIALLMWVRSRKRTWLLVMACAGWLLSFAAAITVIVGTVLERIEVSAWLPTQTPGSSPQVAITWGAWLAFAAGCASAAIAAALLAREPRRRAVTR